MSLSTIFSTKAKLAAEHGLNSEHLLYVQLALFASQSTKEETVKAIEATINNLASFETWQRLFFLDALSIAKKLP